MSEMADFAIDNAFAEEEHFDRYSRSDLATQYDEGIIDERGVIIGEPWSTPTSRTNNFTPASKGAHGSGLTHTGPKVTPEQALGFEIIRTIRLFKLGRKQ